MNGTVNLMCINYDYPNYGKVKIRSLQEEIHKKRKTYICQVKLEM